MEWFEKSKELNDYYNREWGVVIDDDNLLFESLCLESLQSGLSWEIVLKKRESFREAFCDFKIDEVIKLPDEYIDELMNNDKLIKHRAKLLAILNNAKVVKSIQQEFGSFYNYIWSFTDFKIIKNYYTSFSKMPSKSEFSNQFVKDLKKKGINFFGPVTAYSFLQAIGVIQDKIK